MTENLGYFIGLMVRIYTKMEFKIPIMDREEKWNNENRPIVELGYAVADCKVEGREPGLRHLALHLALVMRVLHHCHPEMDTQFRPSTERWLVADLFRSME